VFNIYPEMSEVTAALTEDADVTAVQIGNTTIVTVTLAEQGNAAIVTKKLQVTNLAQGGIDQDIVNMIAYNMATSIDTIYQNEIKGGTNVLREASGALTVTTGARTNVLSTDTVKSRDLRAAVMKLRAGNAMPTRGQLYTAVVHPDVSMDLRAETGAGGWRTPQEYGATQDRLWAGEVGVYEGAVVIENSRVFGDTGGGSSARVRNSYVFGQQAIAEATAVEPHVIIGPVVDRLRRHQPIGWYGVLGVKRFREAALWRIETSTSL
jgi:N4-gp56 family major capsid protein